ncbi:hypothetical protein GGR56DRAFT_675909 [Xylariaceae sp. FL0804]|nr:hypothetical protein GGR56DRAFT_675909 [Xylariaceae sp. FL0804]
MSGRSAYVRKKITEPKPGGGGIGGRVKSPGSSRQSDRDDQRSVNDFSPPLPPPGGSGSGTGYGTTNARFLKFSDHPHHVREPDATHYRDEPPARAGSGHSGGGGGDMMGRRDAAAAAAAAGGAPSPQSPGPMADYAYARARKPVLTTEDVSGIERSGFRSAVDKRSTEVRKGISKAFLFGSKKKRDVVEAPDMPYASTTTAAFRRDPDAHQYAGYDMRATPVASPHHGVMDPEYQQQQQQQQQQQRMTMLTMSSPPPSAKLPPLPPPAKAPPIKRWLGVGRPAQRWNKLRKDPELWDPNGDVLIFLCSRGQLQRPNPSFRLSSHILEATGSRFLITRLREGSTEDNYDYDEPEPGQIAPPSPIGGPPTAQFDYGGGTVSGGGRHGQPTPPLSEDVHLGGDDGQISYEMYFPPPAQATRAEAQRHALATRNVFALLYHASLVGPTLYTALADLLARLDAVVAPGADNVGAVLGYVAARGLDDARHDADTAVALLAWAEAPAVRWEEGWREAFLHAAAMYPRLHLCPDWARVSPVSRALLERACLETQLRVQAAEARLADFSYADMWSDAAGSGRGGAATAATVDTGVRAAADRLQQFLIDHYAREYGTWPPAPLSPDTGPQTTADGEEMWLTRPLARKLQRDFGALYDYLVDRDVVWDESETRSSRKWMMVRTDGQSSFSADSPDLPLTDMLIRFDNRMRFPHIPHPYPLVPESIPPPPPLSPPSSLSPPQQHGVKLGRARSWKKDGTHSSNNSRTTIAEPGGSNSSSSISSAGGGSGSGTTEERMLERRVQLAYTEATNIYALGSEFAPPPLVDAFARFEKADRAPGSNRGAVDPAAARRGRWALLYGVLQTLASVSVDAPHARYAGDSVTYHLSPRILLRSGGGIQGGGGPGENGRMANTTATLPPWKGVRTPHPPEAAHELSYCWTAPRTWRDDEAVVSVSAAGGTEFADDDHDDGDPVRHLMLAQNSRRFPRSQTDTSSTKRSSIVGGGLLTGAPSWGNGSWYSAASVSGFSSDGDGDAAGALSSPAPSPSSPRFPHQHQRNTTAAAAVQRAPSGRRQQQQQVQQQQYHHHHQYQYQGHHYPLAPNAAAAAFPRAQSERSYATFGGASGRGDGEGQGEGRRNYSRPTQPPAPLDLAESVDGTGGFLDIGSHVLLPGDGDVSAAAAAEREGEGEGDIEGGRGGEGAKLAASSSSSDDLGLLIRDFDELDSVAEEHGYDRDYY